ncbi:MAG: class IV adenylate cyclase [Janthinobacterium lividum]
MQAPETELKFPVEDIAAFRARVARLGLILRTERSFEGNTLYDTPTRELRGKRQLLRIRQYCDRFVVTHKRVGEDGGLDQRYKVRIETETLVEDGAAMAEVFQQLGLAPVFRYEKFRTEWDAEKGGHLVLDETPIGTWAELEGEPHWIDAMLPRLDVDPKRCLTDSYGMLFLQWKEAKQSSAENLTFSEIQPSAEMAATPA